MCTTIIVGKNASADGSVIVAHSDDDIDDARIIRVPSFAPREIRNVYYDSASLGYKREYNSTSIRRYIGVDRGPGYNTVEEGYSSSVALGTIPGFTKKTYAYFDAAYGISNEAGLMIGECTCGAKIEPEPAPGKRIFYSAELSRVALERCAEAKEAVLLIAQLIKDYGYYGTGETLLLGDSNEAWVMEMCAYEKDGEDGIWVAQRVPDDHFFVAANQFRIRDIYKNIEDSDNKNELYYSSLDSKGNLRDDLIYSANLFKACNKAKWINTKEQQTLHGDCYEKIDWAATVSYGEYSHPYYSLRRVWRAFSKAAPSSKLPSKVKDGYTKAYPFSLKPDTKLSALNVAAIYRDHYEGTDFDLTNGTAAGPFNNPVRYENNPDQGNTENLNTFKPKGAWERSLSIYRCGMMWINQAQGKQAISWLGLDRPAANCLMPFDCKTELLPEKIETMNLLDFKFNGDSAWWAFNFVANYVNLNYEYMMPELKALQAKCEKNAEQLVIRFLTNRNVDFNSHSETVVQKWWDLAKLLIVTFNDGCITKGPNDIMNKINYSEDWLQKTDYYDGPIEY